MAPNKCFAKCFGLEIVDCADSSGITGDLISLNSLVDKNLRFTASTRQNLTGDFLFLDILSKVDTEVNTVFYDSQGIAIMQNKFNLSEGKNEYRIDLSGRRSGMYFIRIFDSGTSQILKVLLLD